MSNLDDNYLIWVNPARVAEPKSEEGLDLAMSTLSGTTDYFALLHIPLGLTAGVGYANVKSVLPGYIEPVENGFLSLVLAKRGFGGSPWLSGLSLGLATRYFSDVTELDGQGWISQGSLPEAGYWSIDEGLALDVPPWTDFGKLRLGLYALQTKSRLTEIGLKGFQFLWLDGSGLWDLSGDVILDYPVSRNQVGLSSRRSESFPTNRLALDFHLGRISLGAQVLPTNRLIGAMADVDFHTRTLLRDISIGSDLLLGGNLRTQASLGVRFRAGFRVPGDRELAKTYADYHRNAPGYPGPAASPTETIAHVQAAPDTLDQDHWQRNWNLYQEDKIGAWRGIVFPYVNTFGLYTTYLIPAGTSCILVGDYLPGTVMSIVSAGLLVNVILNPPDEDGDASAVAFAVTQPLLKLVDLYLARRFVNRFNEGLRVKYRLGFSPRNGGGALLAKVEF